MESSVVYLNKLAFLGGVYSITFDINNLICLDFAKLVFRLAFMYFNDIFVLHLIHNKNITLLFFKANSRPFPPPLHNYVTVNLPFICKHLLCIVRSTSILDNKTLFTLGPLLNGVGGIYTKYLCKTRDKMVEKHITKYLKIQLISKNTCTALHIRRI